MTTTTDAAALPVRRFPSRIASLGFAMRLPADWVGHDLPEEQPDFADPTRMVPLAAVTAPHAAIVWAVAARPAYGDGTLSDWAQYLLSHHGLQLRSLGDGRLGSLPAIAGEAQQPSELGPLRVRFVFAEDGGRLINLSLTAPELLADAVQGIWAQALESFVLDDPAGSTVPLWPPVGLQGADTLPMPALQADIHSPEHTEGVTVSRPLPLDDGHEPAGASAEAPDVDLAEPAEAATLAAGPAPEDSAAADTDAAWREHALSTHADALDPEQAMNRRLRDGGAGLVPRLVAVDSAACRATVACGAISAQIDLPLGWHVIDDGRRVLVFEPQGDVQIHLDLLPRGEGFEAVLDQLEAQVHRDYPAPETLRLAQAGLHALGVRRIQDGDTSIEQYHLLVDGPDAEHVLRARVTSTLPQATAAANLGELVLRSACFGSFAIPAAAGETGPDWWMAALLLERANRLQEAEACITGAVDHIGAAIQVAELYRHRMLRLLREGDSAGAEAARDQAARWAHHYAACATSGGEGAALSRERDAFLARL